MNWKDVPIPDRMSHLDRDHRGYPIPWIVFRDSSGRAHFTVNNDTMTARCRDEDRCSICGTKLFRARWFVGGPGSAFHEHGAYIDPPMHYECATYALQVCPHLAAPRYTGRIDTKTLDRSKLPDQAIFIDNTMDPNRPDYFVAVMAVGQTLVHASLLQTYIKPKRPYRRVEFWRNGVRLEEQPYTCL